MAKLITFEGPDGAGKTTQARRLKEFLKAQGYRVFLTREPGGTTGGEKIRALLLAEEIRWTEAAEALLYLAARAQHVAEVLRPALARADIVLCDRFSDSTLAYQGYGRGVDLRLLEELNRWVTGGIVPDLTLLLDVEAEVGLARLGKSFDRLEKEGISFQERVRAGFLALAAREPQRIRVIPAGGTEEEVFSQVQKEVLLFLENAKAPFSPPKGN